MPNPFSPNPKNAKLWEEISDQLKIWVKEVRSLEDHTPADVGLHIRIDSDGFSISLEGFETENSNWNSSTKCW